MAADEKPTISEKPIRWRAFWLPKEGHSAEEYEDAFAVEVASGRFAVADGASESAFARLWARLLVEHFVAQRSVEVPDWHDRLPEVQHQWQEALASRQLPWHAEQKVLYGSFATFLGVEIRSGDSGLQWQAVAVGDSCLFHTRGDQLLYAWPLEKSDQFNDSPRLVGSRTPSDEVNYNRALWKLPHPDGKDQLQLSSGDRLWLMTDAMAQWFLTEYESGRCPWQQIDEALPVECEQAPSREHYYLAACGSCGLAPETGANEPAATETQMSEPSAAETNVSEPTATEISTPETAAKQDDIPEPPATGCGAAQPLEDQQRFARWIGELRRSGRLRNDDVTLVEVQIV